MPHLDKLNLIDAMHSIPSSMSVCMNTDECFGMMRMKQMMIHLVSSFPEAKAEPVVRCGECKHWKRIRNDCILASCELDALVRSEDFFCADGERKDGDGE